MRSMSHPRASLPWQFPATPVVRLAHAVALWLTATSGGVAQTEDSKPLLPEVTLAEIHARIASGDQSRVTTICTVLFCGAPGSYHLRDGTGKIRAGYDANVRLKEGDKVRFTGIPLLYQPVPSFRVQGLPGIPWFNVTSMERVGRGEYPAPLPLGTEDLYANAGVHAKYDGEFVSTTGQVIGYEEYLGTYSGPGWAERVRLDVINLETDGRTVQVMFHPGMNLKDEFPIGTRATFLGTCRLGQISSPALVKRGLIHVLVPDLEQTRIVSLPPFWEIPRHRQNLKLGGIALLLCLGAGAAGWWLHHRSMKLQLAMQQQGDLQRALDREQELSKLKTRFVSIVSHEFRTPLGIIGSSAEILEHYEGRLTADQRGEHLRAITENVRRTARMMEDALALSRMDSGGITFNPAPLDVRAFCERLSDEMLSATARKNPIELEVGQDIRQPLPLDESLLRHMLTNLLSNAVKYSPDDLPVKLRVSHRPGDVRFDIQDQGIGIPEADQDRLFEAFHRAENVGSVHGTGLGLVIAKRCCDLHGGKISFVSRDGHGTTFTITLPLGGTSAS